MKVGNVKTECTSIHPASASTILSSMFVNISLESYTVVFDLI